MKVGGKIETATKGPNHPRDSPIGDEDVLRMGQEQIRIVLVFARNKQGYKSTTA